MPKRIEFGRYLAPEVLARQLRALRQGAELKAPLLLIRGMDDPTNPPEYESEIQEKVPGAKYLKLAGAGHFPMAEKSNEVNDAIEELLSFLSEHG
jgi:pimeloyl-ACP methyl ester carboxylesterase